MPDLLLMGSTDVTLAVGNALLDAGTGISGVVTVGESFSISYSDSAVPNLRFADIPKWCERRRVRAIKFSSYDQVLGEIGDGDIPLCLVAGWYHMLPATFRKKFLRGCVGLHASLLPQLRGGAPLNWAILTGLRETGVTMLKLTDGVDDGPIYGQKRLPIGPRTTIGELVEDSARASADLARELTPGIIDGGREPVAQSGRHSYGLQRNPEDGQIDWCGSADAIDRLVRAVGRPYAGAFTYLESEKIQIWAGAPVSVDTRVYGAPGQLARVPGIDHVCVVTGEGLMAIHAVTDEQGDCALDLLRRSIQKRFVSRSSRG